MPYPLPTPNREQGRASPTPTPGPILFRAKTRTNFTFPSPQRLSPPRSLSCGLQDGGSTWQDFIHARAGRVSEGRSWQQPVYDPAKLLKPKGLRSLRLLGATSSGSVDSSVVRDQSASPNPDLLCGITAEPDRPSSNKQTAEFPSAACLLLPSAVRTTADGPGIPSPLSPFPPSGRMPAPA
jgi:hypothetical protein